MGYNTQESLQKTINTVGTLLGVHPIVPWFFPLKSMCRIHQGELCYFSSNLQISEGHRWKGKCTCLILHGCWVYISGTKSNTLKCVRVAWTNVFIYINIYTWIELVYHLECNETTPSNPLHFQSCGIIFAQFAGFAQTTNEMQKRSWTLQIPSTYWRSMHETDGISMPQNYRIHPNN